MTAPYLVWLVLDDDTTLLNRAIGVLRRHDLALRGLTTVPGPDPRLATLTALVQAERGVLDRAVNQLRQIVGVRNGAAVSLAQSTGSPASQVPPSLQKESPS